MSIGSVMSALFGGAQPAAQSAPNTQQQQQAQPSQPGNFPATQNPAMQSDPANVNAPAAATQAANASGAEPQGLDKFNDLWTPVQSPAGAAPEPLINVKPEQMMEVAKKIDFTKVMNPEQLQAVAQGGQGAVAAMAQIMNTVAQTVYAQNMNATKAMVEQAVQKTQDQMRSELPQHIKLQTVSESIRGDNPAFNHPAAAPIMGALQQQLTVKYPNASAAEIANLAKDYMSGFANALTPKAQNTQTQAQQQSAGSFDWDSWAN